MFIRELIIDTFRNLTPLKIEFSQNVNILLGANGSGKTNLLEALATLCLGRSHRMNSTDQALIPENSDHYRLSGQIERSGNSYELAVAYQVGRGKKITLNEQPARASELFREFSLVSLAPEDSEIISSSPGARRKFLDLHLAQSSITHLDNLSQYHRTLQQRNSHLKRYGLNEDGTPFDEQLIHFGSRITLYRAQFIEFASVTAKKYYAAISGGANFDCQYRPSTMVSTKDVLTEIVLDATRDIVSIEKSFTERLQSRRAAEMARLTTLVGPHRDDIEFLIRGFPARTHGSQGEWRSAAIALKLTVFDFIRDHKNKRNSAPLLLLDEIFAELDADRQRALVQSFSKFGQLFLTTALTPPPELAEHATVFEVKAGELTRIQ
ncbi:DNA replication and repair protein RecF [Gemmatimonas aurantiaca]|nr:DNA replication and repair protein RecF [Gemmatimonas aurantiaca]